MFQLLSSSVQQCLSLHAKGTMENAPLLGVARKRKPLLGWVSHSRSLQISFYFFYFFKIIRLSQEPFLSKTFHFETVLPRLLTPLPKISVFSTFIVTCTEQNFVLFPLKQDTFWWIVFFPIALFLLIIFPDSECTRYVNRSIHVSMAVSANKKSFQLLGTGLFWHVIQPWSNQWRPQLSAAICKH